MLTDEQIEKGWHATFSTSNPYCPCNLKSFTKAVRWAEHNVAALAAVAPSDDRADFEATLSVEDSFRQADGTYLDPQAQAAWVASRGASSTTGMTLGERIAHVGGRENAAGYIEFGSVMAVDALIRQALRDSLVAPATRETQDERTVWSEAADECVASGLSCSYGPYGRKGELQCKYCGKERAAVLMLTDEHRTSIENAIMALDQGVAPRSEHANDLRLVLASVTPAASDQGRKIKQESAAQWESRIDRAIFAYAKACHESKSANAMNAAHTELKIAIEAYAEYLAAPTPTAVDNPRRAGFEAWAKPRGYDLKRCSQESYADYVSERTSGAWAVWVGKGESPMSNAARDVLAERARQVSDEGWTPEHDDEHDACEMADAAAAYALHYSGWAEGGIPVEVWPADWSRKWWKPTTPRRDLVKAGALILAEIERLDRAAHGKGT